MTEELEQYFLPLKVGQPSNVRLALIERAELAHLLKTEPQHFSVLLDLAREQSAAPDRSTEAAQKRSIKYLKSIGYISKATGTIRPLARDVLLSGYQLTPDGPTIVQPFVLETPEDRQLADRIQLLLDQHLHHWLRTFGRSRTDPDPPSGRF